MSIVTQVELLKNRRTKIIATIGPASSRPDIVRKLIETGVNVFRLNMSHGDHEFHRNMVSTIRTIAEETGYTVAILADLCGPKIRTGKFKHGHILLAPGKRVTITMENVEGDTNLIPSQYTSLANDVSTGDKILLNDGLIELKVLSVKEPEVICEVIYGGTLSDHKGINMPGVNISAPSLTEKDKQDARFALEQDIDFLALSFVRRAADIEDLRTLIKETGKNVSIIAKIEKPEALVAADQIIDAADGIMVARGDLGVELNPEEVPVAQSQLIDLARSRFKPVIVATQMLESMIESARPTRAEVTDIAHAVTQGTDAIMLSAETAAGTYPVEAVEMMARIVRQTESFLWKQGLYGATVTDNETPPLPVWDVLADATANISKNLMAHAVVVISQSGMSAATMSSARPAAPIVAITKHVDVCRRVALLWGVIPVLDKDAGNINPNEIARQTAATLKLAEPGESILLIRGFHNDPKLNTPSITAITI